MKLIIIIISLIAILLTYWLMKFNMKELENIANNEELNHIANKYPSNVEICKKILKKLNNQNVKIEESPESESTLYIAISNKIMIGNTHNSFTRIQTMAHEALHSIQDRKLLLFNFIYSNIYLLYFIVISVLVILKKIPNTLLFTNILLILSFIYYVIRVYLENDAMIKAEYIAKEYMEEENISTKEELNKVVEGFKMLNKDGIKGTNLSLFINILLKVIIFNVLALIF